MVQELAHVKLKTGRERARKGIAYPPEGAASDGWMMSRMGDEWSSP